MVDTFFKVGNHGDDDFNSSDADNNNNNNRYYNHIYYRNPIFCACVSIHASIKAYVEAGTIVVVIRIFLHIKGCPGYNAISTYWMHPLCVFVKRYVNRPSYYIKIKPEMISF